MSRFPRFISCYFSENRLLLGQCAPGSLCKAVKSPGSLLCALVNAKCKALVSCMAAYSCVIIKVSSRSLKNIYACIRVSDCYSLYVAAYSCNIVDCLNKYLKDVHVSGVPYRNPLRGILVKALVITKTNI